MREIKLYSVILLWSIYKTTSEEYFNYDFNKKWKCLDWINSCNNKQLIEDILTLF